MNMADNVFFLFALYWAGFGISVGMLGMMLWFVVHTVKSIYSRWKS